MKPLRISVSTNGEKAYPVTHLIAQELEKTCKFGEGMVFIFCPHSSCGLIINEAYDPSATVDLENFLKRIAPRNLDFITHTTEGPDDSPSHMKTLLTGSSLAIPYHQGKLCLGQWQGISLLEFRDEAKEREVIIKIMQDR